MDSFLTEEEIKSIGFKYCGKNVCISRNAKIYSAENISIGDNSRIDDFCILSGKIHIGRYVHVSAGSYLFAGDAGIFMDDYSCLSSRGAIYAISDDYSGEYMANATVPNICKNVVSKEVRIGKYALIGSGTTVLPGVDVGEGVAVGSMSLVNKSLKPWGIFFGIPCRFHKERSKQMLEYEKLIDNGVE